VKRVLRSALMCAVLGASLAVAACRTPSAPIEPVIPGFSYLGTGFFGGSRILSAAVSALEWPPSYRPTSQSAWAGASAAKPLVSITTTLPTVSVRPKWAARFTGIIDGVRTNRRVVALTFDDGPTAHTRKIVDELDVYGDHATFFWVGSRITTDAAAYSMAHHEELANHTWNHPNMWKLTSAEASAEIGLTSARIAHFTGAPPTWFRSPFNRLFANELAQIRAHRLLYANYNVTTVDWIAGVTADEILSKLSGSLRPGGVILMHDSPGHNPTGYLPRVLDLLKAQGYEVVTLTELAQMGPPVNEPLTLGIKGLGY
jgi:peptidoglycan/xylan/chitin deacetylase (PgdA/CDA1 family)